LRWPGAFNGIQHFPTEFNISQRHSTFHNAIQHFSTPFNISQRHSTFLNAIQHFSTHRNNKAFFPDRHPK
jgi:hypothetical protein